jgi:hypothetical protein
MGYRMKKIASVLAIWLLAASLAFAQTSPGNVGNGQIGANYGAGYGANNWLFTSSACPSPSLVTAYQFLALTSGAPTSIPIDIWDGSQCVSLGILNATAHTFTPNGQPSLPLSVANGGTGAGSAAPGTANNIGAVGLVATGTIALNTTAVSSGTCGSAQTAAATGALPTDELSASFSADPTATTGYIPSTSGMLTIIFYLTSNTANFKVCNNTTSSITPGGTVTLNWKVLR